METRNLELSVLHPDGSRDLLLTVCRTKLDGPIVAIEFPDPAPKEPPSAT